MLSITQAQGMSEIQSLFGLAPKNYGNSGAPSFMQQLVENQHDLKA